MPYYYRNSNAVAAGAVGTGAVSGGSELYASKNPGYVICINMLLMAIFACSYYAMDSKDASFNTEAYLSTHNIPFYVFGFILFVTLLTMCICSLTFTTDDPEDKSKFKNISFNVGFWASLPLYVTIVTAILCLFSMASTRY
ncbi:hypothetical protein YASMINEVIRUS_1028 [Yasminevirus sp. GU-2018]|uniref:Uncharacterized protein n=1 Tax=Yasminevirus sp. GU-2018 TaxID=2420051 RepID=A0A5K0UA04_9VIRU|nr:hypothetical protein YASMINEVIRUS_1028 [Yasminevirus sp. GU-2018]